MPTKDHFFTPSWIDRQLVQMGPVSRGLLASSGFGPMASGTPVGDPSKGPADGSRAPRKTALVTGSSRGLGAVLAEHLAARGYDLILTARGTEALGKQARRLAAYGGEVVARAGDVAEPDHRRRLAEEVRSRGRLDLLVNNASTLGTAPLPSLDLYPLEDLRSAFRTNLEAPLALVQATLPQLEAAMGMVVNVSSDAARGGYPGWGGYGATKAALDLVSKTLAGELETRGVSVVAVDPGDLRTEMHQRAFPGEDISDRPLPEVTLPFWAWLLGQEGAAVSGRRFEAQGKSWEVSP